MPSRTEIILQKVFNACVTAAVLCIVAAITYGLVLGHNRNLRFGIIFVIPLIAISVVSGLALIPLSVARWWLALKRPRSSGPSQELLVAANSLPVVADAFDGNSILYVFWSVDYYQSFRLNLRWQSQLPSLWMWALLSGLMYVFLSFLFVPTPAFPIYVRSEAFLIGVALDILTRIGRISGKLRKTFGPATPVQNCGLIVNPDRIVFIIGDNRINYPWAVVGRTWEASGIVLYQRNKTLGMIPDYAFQSRKDSRAFVATVNALKKGLPRPEYDWSGYVPKAHTSEGVWPPPIV